MEYVGEYKDGKRNGQGTFTYLDGRKYEGELKYGVLHGHGTWTSSDGKKYVGKWKNGNFHGHAGPKVLGFKKTFWNVEDA